MTFNIPIRIALLLLDFKEKKGKVVGSLKPWVKTFGYLIACFILCWVISCILTGNGLTIGTLGVFRVIYAAWLIGKAYRFLDRSQIL